MIYQIKVQIKGLSSPTVWRRFLIPSDASFANLHEVIQKAFGWHDRNLYKFTKTVDNQKWTITEEGKKDGLDKWFENIKAKDAAIEEFLNADCKRIVYTYRLGRRDYQQWVHSIILEKMDVQKCADPEHAHCKKGSGCLPAETCEDPWLYERMKDFISKKYEWAMLIAQEKETDVVKKKYYNIHMDDDVYDRLPYAGIFFQLTDGKPDFAKIDLDKIESEISKIKLDKVTKKARRNPSDKELTLEDIYNEPILKSLFEAILLKNMGEGNKF